MTRSINYRADKHGRVTTATAINNPESSIAPHCNMEEVRKRRYISIGDGITAIISRYSKILIKSCVFRKQIPTVKNSSAEILCAVAHE